MSLNNTKRNVENISLSQDSAKRRKTIEMEKKLEIINRKERGEKTSDIARSLKMAPSTISTIIKQAESIKESVERGRLASSGQLVTKIRNSTMEELEKILCIWIEHQNAQNCPISGSLIKEKAIKIWDNLLSKKQQEPSTSSEAAIETFVASNGWLEKFKKRYNLHSIKKTGEAASADNEAASKFIQKLKDIIREGNYLPQQVFNFDETGVNWKKLPNRTYISRKEKTSPGYKISKERLTVVFGANATGDFKFKPFVIGRSENPRALKGIQKSSLPVIYKSNTKAWMTSTLCVDYVKNHLSKEIKDYNQKMNFDNKALLLLDNAPGHPQSLDNTVENIKVVFFPPNTTSLIQPMDQGVIAAFKANYLREVMRFIINESDENEELSLIETWKKYNMKHALNNIGAVWNQMRNSTMNAVWRKLWPEVVDAVSDVIDTSSITSDIVIMATQAGIEGVDEEGIRELLNEEPVEISIEDVQEILEESRSKSSTEDDEPQKNLSRHTLSEIFSKMDETYEMIRNNDPDDSRSCIVINAIKKNMMCYKQMLDEFEKKSKQLKIDNFFTK